MKIEDLTIEKVQETVNLMKQLRVPRSIIEMAKELDVKRTDLMRYINEHPKNINWNVFTYRKYGSGGRVTSQKQVAEITGVFLDPHENPLTEEYAEDRKKEHWIRLERIFYEGWVHGFQVAIPSPTDGKPITHSWENQAGDIEKYKKLPGVGRYRFALGYAQGSHWSDWHDDSVLPKDLDEMINEGHKVGLRFHLVGFSDDEITSLLKDMPNEHYTSNGQRERTKQC